MRETRADLIYDVGLYDGGDTAYYLFRGYNVVAIDANPLMIEKARSRFSREIETGQLTLLNVGVSDAAGTATFWVSDVPEWSSFDRSIASRDGTPNRPISVPVMPFSRLLSENGLPHYLKIDIEGNDRLCVDGLRGNDLPKFISVEAECVGDSTVLSDEQATEMLELLRELGYTRFKLVNQYNWASVRPNPVTQFCKRVAASAARGRLRVRGVSAIAERFTDAVKIEALGFHFSPGSSGPWGDEIPGEWMTFDKAKSTYLRERRAYFSPLLSSARPLYSFWHDWHATF